jgi:hypothetical protein
MTNRVSSVPAKSNVALLPRHAGRLTAYDELCIKPLGNDYVVDGSGTVTRLPTLPKGTLVWLRMAGTPTFANSARLICPSNQNYTAVVGDLVLARSSGSGVWRIYVLSNSAPLLAPNNLSDLPNAATARTNLGVYTSPDTVSTDLNTLVTGGMFFIEGSCTNQPVAGVQYYLIVQKYPLGSGFVQQTAWEIYGGGGMWTRSQGSGTWSAWIRVMVGANNLSELTNKVTAKANLGLPILNPKDYGAVGDGVTDDTAAIQACFNAATAITLLGLKSGLKVVFPHGAYAVGALTLNASAMQIEGSGYVVLMAYKQTVSAPVLDATSCNALNIRNLAVWSQKMDGTAPTVMPSIGLLLAQTGAATSNVNKFDNFSTVGYYAYAGTYINGSTNNKWDFCKFGNLYASGYACAISMSNILGVAGVSAGPFVVADLMFDACEFHARHLDATSQRATIVLDGAANVVFDECLFDQSGPTMPTIQFYGNASNNITFLGGKAYKEFSGGSYKYFLDATGISASKVRVINLSLNPPPTTANYAGTFTDLVFNVPEGRSAVGLGAKANLSTGSTVFFGSGSSSTADDTWLVIPEAGVLSTFRYQGAGSPGAGQTFTHTLRKNGVDTALTCSNTGGAITASDTTNKVAVAAGDYISVKSVASATAANSGSNFFGVSFTPTG